MPAICTYGQWNFARQSAMLEMQIFDHPMRMVALSEHREPKGLFLKLMTRATEPVREQFSAEAKKKPWPPAVWRLIATVANSKIELTRANKRLTNFLIATKTDFVSSPISLCLFTLSPPPRQRRFSFPRANANGVANSCGAVSSFKPPAPIFQHRLTPQESGCYIESFKDTGEFTLRSLQSIWMVPLAALALFACGCAVSKKMVVKPGQAPGPLLTATRTELIKRYNQQAAAVTSLNATVSMKLTAGSAYSGVIEQYHEVNGFILASRHASIRVIGQAPVVGKNIFDMVSDGETFHIFIPSKNKFLEGKADLERLAKKPIENLRPQHLVDALLWSPIEKPSIVLFEEANEASGRYYVLTVVHAKITDTAFGGLEKHTEDWWITRKIWFDRWDLSVVRIEIFYANGKVNSASSIADGKVISDVRYGDWKAAGAINYPRQITISRPGDDYKLEIVIKKIALNETIAADRFVLQQPPGTDLVHVGEDAKEQP